MAALKAMWKRQVRQGINAYTEEKVFGEYIKWCLKETKSRKYIQGKKNYVEKIEAAFAPLSAVKYVKDIEQHLFN